MFGLPSRRTIALPTADAQADSFRMARDSGGTAKQQGDTREVASGLRAGPGRLFDAKQNSHAEIW